MLWSANTLELRNVAAQILQNEIGVQPCGDLQAIFWADESGKIEWVVGYTAFIGKTCQMHMVNLKGGYTPKQLLKSAFDYPFNHCELEKVFFYSNITLNSIWNEFDVLLTANPNLLLNHPKDKIVIKFETEYNKDIKKEHSITKLKELEDILKQILC